MNIKTNRFLKIIFMSAFFIIVSLGHTNAAKLEVNTNYTKEYKKWLSLSEEERKNYIEPQKFATDYIENKKEVRLFAAKAKFLDRFSLAENISIRVKNQEQTGSCWAFSATSIIETNLEKILQRSIELSPRYIEYFTSKTFSDGINSNGYNREVGEGGSVQLALNHITSGFGPVSEKDMPFENNENKISLSEIANKNIPIKVNEYVNLPSLYKEYNNDGTVSKYTNGQGLDSENRIEYTDDQVQEIRNQYKNHILNYGALSANTYAKNNKYFNLDDEKYEYYCNNSEQIANHAITIVGWDDTYKKENFSSEYGIPEHDGAYIVLNSWGNSWSTDGYYYISYDDSLIEKSIIGIVETEDKNYNNIYQHDLLGSNIEFGYTKLNTAYIANVFDRKETNNVEKLEEISFYTSRDVNVKIYVNSLDKKLNISNMTYLGRMDNVKIGYHTFKLDNSVLLENESYAISLEISNPNSTGIFFSAETEADDGLWATAVTNTDESYVSIDGENWADIYDNRANCCIKGFTTITGYKSINDVTIEGVKKQENNVIKLNTVNISSVKNVSTKSAKVTWKKDSNVDGYEIYMATVKKDSKNMKTKTKIALRKSTSVKSKSLKTIPKGAKIKIIKKNVKKSGGYTWYKVKYDGKTGYVASKYLEDLYVESSYKKIKIISNKNTINYTQKKLSKNKIYAFKIRAYKKVNGKIYYGSYSKIKKVTIKK